VDFNHRFCGPLTLKTDVFLEDVDDVTHEVARIVPHDQNPGSIVLRVDGHTDRNIRLGLIYPGKSSHTPTLRVTADTGRSHHSHRVRRC